MRQYLLWWNKLPKPKKQELMKSKNIKSITYEQIKLIYNETK